MAKKKTGNQVRIIGGQWRGRKIQFPEAPGLRPTPDRVRETLFNWLGGAVQGASCLDCFAGSGALGFEALSRGAARVLMLEQSPVVIKQLTESASLFPGADMMTICRSHLPQALAPATQSFDIIFLDPPFGLNLLIPTCQALVVNGYVHAGTLIYLETESTFELSGLPTSWQQVKSKVAGQVRYYLFQVD